MSPFRKFMFASTAVISLGLTACQQVVKPVSGTAMPGTEQARQFHLQGKIGVRTPQQSGSAFFDWQQNQDHFNLQLSGILGIGKTIIEGQPGQVTLNSAKTGEITAASPEELLEKATGWVAPITHIVNWVQARPATANAKIQRDSGQRMTELEEDGWVVNLSYNDTAVLPNKLILKQQTEAGKENRITMIIQNR
ncbi:lipoprotein insertase outer membrane protein LolB [Acinetobacter sp. WZC-1]|uniref:lipoprotein insertase outer membrane protein LolB n=1 Tax=Acinetobacter sp. WZC-1 TaxID=3459034 RepID=UPI00403E0AC4